MQPKLSRAVRGTSGPSRAPIHPGRLGRYDVVALLGEGGMARAYLALSHGAFDSTKLVVVKHIRPEIASDEQFAGMFADEARLALRLAHANVVQTFDVVNEQDQHLLVMEYLDGRSLGHVLRQVGREEMPLAEHLWILTQVLAGLHYAHTLEDFDGSPLAIVHRDVSPANLFITFGGEVKLLDFGIAKASGAIATTREGVIKGKLGYAAPEQCLGRTVDRRADIYAVGVLLWEAMARRRRTFGDTELALLQARVTNSEPPIEEVWPDVPAQLAAISARALASNPDARYPTALEFQRDLEAYLATLAAPVGGSDVARLVNRAFHDARLSHSKLIRECVNAARAAALTDAPSTDLEEHRSLPTLNSLAPSWDASQSKIVGRLGSRAPLAAGVLALAIAGLLWAALGRKDDGASPPTLAGSNLAVAGSSSSLPAAAPQSSQSAPEPPESAPLVPDASPSAPAAVPHAQRSRAPITAPRAVAAKRDVVGVRSASPQAFQPGMDLGAPDQPGASRPIEEQDPFRK